jgi:pimeloyl-ACP methyl ester carboxylesterase
LVGLAYDLQGEGPDLVLLHGLGHRRQGWDPVLDLLTPHRRVIRVDLPGHGESPDLKVPAGTDPVEEIGAQLTDLLSELGIERPHMVGNSLGGALALGAAARGHARSVTGLSPAGFWAAPWQFPYTKSVFQLMATAAGGLLAPILPELVSSPLGRVLTHGAIVAHPGRVSAEQAVGDARSFSRAKDAVYQVLGEKMSFTEAASIPADVPVTIAWGEWDLLLPISQARVAKEHLPQARFVLLRGCGHVPMSDDPRSIARIILQGSRED